MYQAYVCAFTVVASQLASSDQEVWKVSMEDCAGMGRLDLILYRDDEAVIHEYERIALSKKDKENGYDDWKRERLTKEAEKGLRQIEVRGYQASRIRYWISWLGAVVGRSLKRTSGGQWKIEKSHCQEREAP